MYQVGHCLSLTV